MSKAENIVDLINAGIKAETLRQKAIANNIANLETPGYRRIDVRFEELLARCLSSSGNLSLVRSRLKFTGLNRRLLNQTVMMSI
jgi:flagellar basal-body rod protein FlgB